MIKTSKRPFLSYEPLPKTPPLLSKKRKRYVVLGLFLITAGILCNQSLLVRWSPDDVFNLDTRIKIGLSQLILLGSGILFFRFQDLWLIALQNRIRRFASAHSNLTAFLAGIFLSVSLLAVVDLSLSRYISRMSAKPAEKTVTVRGYPQLVMPDPDLGYRHKPNLDIELYKEVDEKIIYRALCTTDPFGRRTVPIRPDLERPYFLLFFADSFIFGEGVSNYETLPYYAGGFATAYRPYNYGVRGYGPQHMLALLKNGELLKQVPQKKGILFYLFIDDHVRRAVGTWETFMGFLQNSPYYHLGRDGRLVRKGNFSTGRPFLSFLYRWLDRRGIVQFFHLNNRQTTTKQHLWITFRMIQEAQSEFSKQFDESLFYVVFYPGSRFAPSLIPYLEKAHISYLDYSSLWDPHRTPNMTIGKEEGHPSAAAYQLLAKQLAEDLALAERKL